MAAAAAVTAAAPRVSGRYAALANEIVECKKSALDFDLAGHNRTQIAELLLQHEQRAGRSDDLRWQCSQRPQ